MNIKTIVKVVKVVALVTTVVPPVIEGANIVVRSTTKFVKNRFDKSEYIQEIKKDFELRKDGVVTVKFEEV